MTSELERGIIRPTGPGDVTQWQGILQPSGDPSPNNWDCVNDEAVDPANPAALVLSEFGSPVGLTDLYNVSAHISAGARIASISVSILALSFAFGGPAPEGEIALIMRASGSEFVGRTVQLPGTPLLVTERFEGEFQPRGDPDWLQIGIRKMGQDTTMFVLQVYGLIQYDHPRKRAMPGGR